MEIKPQAQELKLIPAVGGIIVQKLYGAEHEGRLMDPPHVFTDHADLARFLYQYFVDTEAELRVRAEKA